MAWAKNKMPKRDRIDFPFEWIESLLELGDDMQRMMSAIRDYVSSGNEPSFTGALAVIWSGYKRFIDKEKEKKNNISKRNKENIAKRWSENDTKSYQTIPDDTRRYQTIPDDTKSYQTIPNYTTGIFGIINERERESESGEKAEKKENFPPIPLYKEKRGQKEGKEQEKEKATCACELFRLDANENEQQKSCYSFDDFWRDYDKKVGRVRSEQLYGRIGEADRVTIKSVVRRYVAATPDKQYRKDPATWLHNRCWDDEVIQPRKSGDIGEHTTFMEEKDINGEGFL